MSKGTFSRRMQAKTYTGIKLKPLRIKQNKNFPEKKSDSLQTFQPCLIDSFNAT